MKTIYDLWNSKIEADWKLALENYWKYVRPENLALEKELNDLKITNIAEMNPLEWFDFLNDKYFRWKYTMPNRYASTTMHLRKYKSLDKLNELFEIKLKILKMNSFDIKQALLIASNIKGLGIADASGLLSLLYPNEFATVDQFVVKALRRIPDLNEKEMVLEMNQDSLRLKDGIILIEIMRRKSKELNALFNTKIWSPRKIDMILWASR
jgi:thermostable 8-oxoguanine DNA glycosylase